MNHVDIANETFLKPAEVAKLLQVSPAQVYKLVREGVLPHIRILGTVRVPQSHLEEALQDFYVKPADDSKITPNV